jgi:hypothetical protein
MELHPDRNKQRDTIAQWLVVNSAYEILTSPERKARYDRYGTVDDAAAPRAADENPFEGISERYFHFPQPTVQSRTPLLTSDTIDDFLSTDEECMILVYSSVLCPECCTCHAMFEELALTHSSYAQFARIDVALGENLAPRFGVTGMPTIVYYRNDNGRILTDHIPQLVRSTAEVALFLSSHWDGYVRALTSQAAVSAFLAANRGIPKVIQIVRRASTALQFQKLASQYHNTVDFGIIDESDFPNHMYQIHLTPSWVVYRMAPSSDYRIYSAIRDVRVDLGRWALPTMVELHRYNLRALCGSSCLVRVGEPDAALVRRLCSFNMSTFWVQGGTAVNSLGAAEGDWLLLRPVDMRFARLPKVPGDELNGLTQRIGQKLIEKPLPEGFALDWQVGLGIRHGIEVVMASIHGINMFVINLAVTACVVGYCGWQWIARKREATRRQTREPQAEQQPKEKEQPENPAKEEYEDEDSLE